MRRRRFVAAASTLAAGSGCSGLPSSESETASAGTATGTPPATEGDRTEPPPDTFATISVEQSPPDSPVVETSVGVERQATADTPTVIHATYRYTGETSQRTTDWGSPLPFHRAFAADSPVALVPPRGFGARPYSKLPERIKEPEESWIPEDDDEVVLDADSHPCWRAEENLFSPDDSPNVDLSPGTTMTQYYWVVAVAGLSGTCVSPGRYTHTIDRVPPADDGWSLTATVEADR